MEIKIIGSTKLKHNLKLNDALLFGATAAGVCYMQDSFEKILEEDIKKIINRKNMTLNNGHHSVYAHTNYNLLLENIPKSLAMILNNEKVYTTSEKSARYTKMKLTNKEKKLYNKWMEIFNREIEKIYPKMKENNRIKLSQENARYLSSVHTPTTMIYSTNLRQLNYIMHHFNNFINLKNNNNLFNSTLKESMINFNNLLKDLYVEELDPKEKFRELSFFAKREKNVFFDELYSTNYLGSFAQLAQAQRHRTINYEIKEIKNPGENGFYIPPIIEKNDNLKNIWLNDLDSIKNNFPQATLIKINESGKLEDFISKAAERLCSFAQLEITNQTKKTLKNYIKETENSNPEIYNILQDYNKGPRCTFPNYKCKTKCFHGPKNGIERLI